MSANQFLYSTVRNPGGSSRFYGFLPPHGRTLKAGEEFTFVGDLASAVRQHGRSGSGRNLASLERALQIGALEIRHTPGLVLESTSQGLVRQVILSNAGAIALISPGQAFSDSLENIYRHFQTAPLTVWTVHHNSHELTPRVRVVSTGGNDITDHATVKYIDGLTLLLTFATATSGTAFIG